MVLRDGRLNILFVKLATIVVAFLLLAADGVDRGAAAASPFSGLAGSWAGSGTLTLRGGVKERVRCRATYSVTNRGLQAIQDLRCASDSYKFELKGDVVHNNGTISGRWEETTRALGGNVFGRGRSGRIDARIEGPTFSALLTLTTRGNRQTVAIRSPGSEVEEVLINLRRR